MHVRHETVDELLGAVDVVVIPAFGRPNFEGDGGDAEVYPGCFYAAWFAGVDLTGINWFAKWSGGKEVYLDDIWHGELGEALDTVETIICVGP